MNISQELQEKIDALPEGNLKARIIRALTGPGKRTASNEEIFENLVRNHTEVMAQRALSRNWQDDEILAFIDYFKQRIPEDYTEFLNQQRMNSEIDDDLWWRLGHLADQWISDLDFHDRTVLLGKVRDHIRAHLK